MFVAFNTLIAKIFIPPIQLQLSSALASLSFLIPPPIRGRLGGGGLIACFALTACVTTPDTPKTDATDTTVPAQIRSVSFDNLPGWDADNVIEALPALKLSCARILKNSASKKFGTLKPNLTYGDFQPACRSVMNNTFKNNAAFKAFIENRFSPYAVSAGGDADGLFTGYYESSLKGARTRTGAYKYPLYTRPSDLVMVNLGDFREELKGQRIAGRIKGGNLKPYEDRTQIVSGQWPHNDKVLVWVDDPVDAFFVQIQGSGVIAMNDGSVMRIGYAGQNGHPYYAIGRELIKRGALTKKNVSMQSIRKWLADNPNKADEVMNTNKSYVFFEEKTVGGAVGAEGVVLTPERSLAVDRTKIPYGLPMFLSTDEPKLNRMMIAQDTGGAIRGAVRGDVFWGFGNRAETMAGGMKATGKYWALLPK